MGVSDDEVLSAQLLLLLPGFACKLILQPGGVICGFVVPEEAIVLVNVSTLCHTLLHFVAVSKTHQSHP